MTNVSNPTHSIWINANAGSGKTKVLIDRLVSLLLHGVPASQILCLTFTKAAATEMTHRIQEKLTAWSTLSDAALKSDLNNLGVPITEHTTSSARILVLDILESPIPIQTIHGFCQKLLKQFPIESGLSPHFHVIDEQEAKQLLQEAAEKVMRGFPNDQKLSQAFYNLTQHMEFVTFEKLLQEMVDKAHKVLPRLNSSSESLANSLNIRSDETLENLETAFFESIPVELKNTIPILLESKPADQKMAMILKKCLESKEKANIFADYKPLFLTSSGELRKKIVSVTIEREHPAIFELLYTEAERTQNYLDERNALKTFQKTDNLQAIARSLFKAYADIKAKRGAVDYDDLIASTRTLLKASEQAHWVRFKVDNKISHILVDEAQDTNFDQWDIIQAITEEFFTDNSQQSAPKSIFTVGDDKQSIYGFQGAEPEAFHRMKDTYQQKVSDSAFHWHDLALQKSYRSSPAVLRAVDAVFKGMATHIAHKKHSGSVTIWPTVPAQENDQESGWSIDIGTQTKSSSQLLADALALEVKKQLASHRFLTSKQRAIEPRDIMILVRRRTTFVHQLIGALRKQGVPVSGPDRLHLQHHIAVQDFMSLFQFITLPEDDFNLACLLKSPFFGITEEKLFIYAQGRPESLLASIAEKEADLYARLQKIQDLAETTSPYQLLTELLYKQNILTKFTRRLSNDVSDIIEEFLSVLLRYDQSTCPTYHEFIKWFQEQEIEVKREFDPTQNNTIRIQTVHSAKGLQAPIVILPDTTQKPKHRDSLLFSEDHFYYKTSDLPNSLKHLTDAQKEKDDAEHDRLLYVAMTRAEEALYITGWESQLGIQDGSWYNKVTQSLTPFSEIIPSTLAGITGDTLVLADPEQEPLIAAPESETQIPSIMLPDYAITLPLPESAPTHITPSSYEDTNMHASTGTDRQQAQLRGILIHKLLEVLPNYNGDMHAKAYELIGNHSAKKEIVSAALKILQNPDLDFLFGPTSLAEVSFESHTEEETISGQIDRLVVQDDHVLIVDYKTTSHIPFTTQDVSESYKFQLELYRKAIQKIYPSKTVTCAILWTESGHLMECSTEELQQDTKIA